MPHEIQCPVRSWVQLGAGLSFTLFSQLKSDEGKTYHPRVCYEPTSLGDLSVGIGDSLRVFGNGRKSVKTFSLTSSEVGYVPASILRQMWVSKIMEVTMRSSVRVMHIVEPDMINLVTFHEEFVMQVIMYTYGNVCVILEPQSAVKTINIYQVSWHSSSAQLTTLPWYLCQVQFHGMHPVLWVRCSVILQYLLS